jgi:hypothetical protein
MTNAAWNESIVVGVVPQKGGAEMIGKNKLSSLARARTAAVLCGCLMLLLAGCGTVEHKLTLDPGFQPQGGTLVSVGEVKNQTGQTFDCDAEQLLTDALAGELRKHEMLAPAETPSELIVKTQITEYQPGDAFKRWLLPGWGATVLTVHCDLYEKDHVVGSADVHRTVTAGGAYTIGAWKTIFANVAKDLVSDLRKQMPRSI